MNKARILLAERLALFKFGILKGGDINMSRFEDAKTVTADFFSAFSHQTNKYLVKLKLTFSFSNYCVL